MISTFLVLVLATARLPREFAAWRMCFDRNGDICVANGAGEGQRIVVKDGSTPKWSPDKRRIAFVRKHDVWVVNADGKMPHRIFKSGIDEQIRGISWGKGLAPSRGHSPDPIPHESILIARGNQVFHIAVNGSSFDSATDFPAIDPPRVGTYFAPAISPNACDVAVSVDGDAWMAYADPRTKPRDGWEFTRIAALAVYDQPSYRVSRENVYLQGLDWSPNGRMLACGMERFGGSGTAEVILLRFGTNGSPYTRLKGIRTVTIAEDAYRPSFSPDGKWVLCTSVFGRGLMAISLNGRVRHDVEPDGRDADW